MKVAVIGAGTMGTGIVQTFAQTEGYEVVLCSSGIESATRGKEKIKKQLMSRVNKGKITQEAADNILSKIIPGVEEECHDCDLLIDCVPEVLEKKRSLFLKMDAICKAECIFASNTSSLSITELAADLSRPLVGMHFFNPAPVMKLVEVIPGLNTPPKTVEKIIEIAKSLGKVPVEVQETAGFVVNRLLIPMINEGIGLYAEGIATAEGIDNAMKFGANHPMGPLALGDLIGLDVCLAIMDVLYSETCDSKYRAHPLLRKMVRGGKLGQKSGEGFFTYK